MAKKRTFTDVACPACSGTGLQTLRGFDERLIDPGIGFKEIPIPCENCKGRRTVKKIN